MPKKRSVKPDFNKRLQRLYSRVGHGVSTPLPATPREAQDAPKSAVPATPATPDDIRRMLAAQQKRERRRARNRART